METAQPSAMPTSKKRSGKAAWNWERPVPLIMAAVMAHTRRSCWASWVRVRPKTAEKFSPDFFFALPVAGSKGDTP